MNAGSFLSKLLLVISIAVLVVVFIIFPSLLENPNSAISLSTLQDVWESKSGHFELPIITNLSTVFSGNVVLRYVLFVFLVLLGGAAEFFIKNKKMSGLVHALNLIIGMLIGALFLFSLVVPFLPL